MRIVHSLDELRQLPSEPAVNGLHAREALRLEIPRISPDVTTRAQDSLNRLQQRRGSLVASSVMFLTLVVGVLKAFQRHPVMTWRAAFEFAAVLLVSMLLGAIAKMVTLSITRWQFARRCRAQYELLSRLVQRPAAR